MSTIETNVVKPEVKFFENETENLLITPFYENELDSKVKNIEDFMNNNDGKGKTDDEKDALYKGAQELWGAYATSLKDAKYNFHLNRPQWKFVTDLVLSKLEYDVNTVFFAIELTDLLGSMRDVKFSDDNQLIPFPVNATEITYIYHLISKHKVKGLTKDAYLFSEILIRIGNISKIFNYYDTLGKNLSGDVQDWVTSFEDGVILEKNKVTESTEITE
jgi:hypothetical protein